MRLLRTLLFKSLRYSGLPFLFREVFQRKKVTIVMFHDMTPDYAERSFTYLARKYNIIDLNDFLEACSRGDDSSLPDKALIITLDDGHIQNYELLPVIKKLNIPVTIFLCAGIIDTHRHYWFKFNHPDLFKPALKQMPNEEKLERLKVAGFWPTREYNEPQALTKSQILEMKEHINFQGHTLFHPCLPKCYDEEAMVEIFQSKQILEQEFDLAINAIAYPNGDYSERDVQLVKDAGYSCGITVDYGFNTIKTDPFRLKRLSVYDTDNIDAVSVKASGVWTLLMSWIGKRRDTGWMESVEQKKKVKKEVFNHFIHVAFFHLLDTADVVSDMLFTTSLQ